MAHACPDCGVDVEYTPRPVRLLSGTCPGCGKTSLLIAGADTSVERLPSGPAVPEESPTEELPPEAGAADSPTCALCGGQLAFNVPSETEVVVECSGCHERSTYILRQGFGERPSPPRPSRGRPETGRGRFADRPNARPCRECGGPLTFSTNDDGLVTGECGSCGNRFTLPPRRGPPGRNDRSFGRGQGGYAPGGYRPKRWSDSSRPRGRPSRGRFGRGRPPRTDEDDDASERRRRRDRD